MTLYWIAAGFGVLMFLLNYFLFYRKFEARLLKSIVGATGAAVLFAIILPLIH